MKIVYKRLVFPFFFVPLIVGCIQNVDLNFKTEDPEYVLNCILNTQQDTVAVWLSKSKAITSGNGFEAVENAKITLFEEGLSVGLFSQEDTSAYTLNYKPVPGKSYRIEAEIGDTKVWGETTIPATIETAIIKDNNRYKILFSDNPKEENFYWISATGYQGIDEKRTKNSTCFIHSSFEYADDFNRIINEYGYFKFEYDYYMRFEDSILPKEEIQVSFTFFCIQPPFEVFLLSTDYHLDKYMKSSIILERMDLFMDDTPIIYLPFPVYSNIHNGTGIFGSVSPNSQVFE